MLFPLTIRIYPGQKPWIEVSIPTKLKTQTIAFNHGKVTGNTDVYQQTSDNLRKVIKGAKLQYRDNVESQFNGS